MITFRIIFGFIPVPIIWTDRFMPDWCGGKSFGVFCIIRPKYRKDEGLIQHELTHCRQFCRTFGSHAIRYSLDEGYRLDAEVEAYRVQLSRYPTSRNAVLFATFIANRYSVDISIFEALRRLES